VTTSQPPGPRLSTVGALRAIRRDPIALLERAASFGDVSHVRLPRVSLYLLNRPDLARDVLVDHHRDVRKGPTMDAARRVLGESLLTSEGEHHMRQRRLIQPMFHHERVEAYGASMVELAERAAARWSDGGPLDVHAEMARLTLAIVGRTIFDVDVEAEHAREVAGALDETLAQFNRALSPFLRFTERLPLPANRRFQRARGVFDRTIHGMIAERRKAGLEGGDLLSLLLRAREGGSGMTDEQVRDEAVTLFLAGHETTSNALTWTWYVLGEHPSIRAELEAELDDVLDGRAPSVADVRRLTFTDAVLKEAMRCYPPAWAIGRRLLADHEADGYVLPAGSVLVVSPWLLHHDRRWWEEPAAFRPERWIDAETERPRHAYLPFGAGPRMCVGEEFARLEAVLLLATIAARWRFEHDPGHRVELQPVITLRPRTGMPMTARRRAPHRAHGAA
jgi:cytochrome P450